MKLNSLNDLKGSESFRRLNASILQPGNSGPATVMESNPSHAPLAAEKVQGSTGARVLVRVTSVRKRLLDTDNLCEKYHVDLCRYAGVIPNDTPDQVEIQVSQRKTENGEAEFTEIVVMPL